MAFDLGSLGNVLGSLKGLGGGGSKATSNSTSSSSATNALNLAFNPVLANDVGSALWPTTGGDAYGSPTSTASTTASASDSNPSSQIPWYYPGGTAAYDVGAYKGANGSGYYTSGTATSGQSSMVLFGMMGIALIFLMKGK